MTGYPSAAFKHSLRKLLFMDSLSESQKGGQIPSFFWEVKGLGSFFGCDGQVCRLCPGSGSLSPDGQPAADEGTLHASGDCSLPSGL